uniref:Uncharacterized protein n=1 Tax=Anguilla anguilla TaxID=7936 RepID=A0A0E9Q5R9_ANGAN
MSTYLYDFAVTNRRYTKRNYSVTRRWLPDGKWVKKDCALACSQFPFPSFLSPTPTASASPCLCS